MIVAAGASAGPATSRRCPSGRSGAAPGWRRGDRGPCGAPCRASRPAGGVGCAGGGRSRSGGRAARRPRGELAEPSAVAASVGGRRPRRGPSPALATVAGRSRCFPGRAARRRSRQRLRPAGRRTPAAATGPLDDLRDRRHRPHEVRRPAGDELRRPAGPRAGRRASTGRRRGPTYATPTSSVVWASDTATPGRPCSRANAAARSLPSPTMIRALWASTQSTSGAKLGRPGAPRSTRARVGLGRGLVLGCVAGLGAALAAGEQRSAELVERVRDPDEAALGADRGDRVGRRRARARSPPGGTRRSGRRTRSGPPGRRGSRRRGLAGDVGPGPRGAPSIVSWSVIARWVSPRAAAACTCDSARQASRTRPTCGRGGPRRRGGQPRTPRAALAARARPLTHVRMRSRPCSPPPCPGTPCGRPRFHVRPRRPATS